MITTPKEYYSLYHRIQSENPTNLALLLPSEEKIYNIDLNKRTIESPEFLSVETDHSAEVIYFKVNRFYDFFDLSQSVCVINYINALGEQKVYPVPFFDIETYGEDDIMLFPWLINGDVAKAAGNVQYSISFYKLTDSGKQYLYNLNTIPSTSKILHGIGELKDLGEETEDELKSFFKAANIALNRLNEEYGLFWEESN